MSLGLASSISLHFHIHHKLKHVDDNDAIFLTEYRKSRLFIHIALEFNTQEDRSSCNWVWEGYIYLSCFTKKASKSYVNCALQTIQNVFIHCTASDTILYLCEKVINKIIVNSIKL